MPSRSLQLGLTQKIWNSNIIDLFSVHSISIFIVGQRSKLKNCNQLIYIHLKLMENLFHHFKWVNLFMTLSITVDSEKNQWSFKKRKKEKKKRKKGSTRQMMFGWVLWHINTCGLFFAESCLYMYIRYMLWCCQKKDMWNTKRLIEKHIYSSNRNKIQVNLVKH